MRKEKNYKWERGQENDIPTGDKRIEEKEFFPIIIPVISFINKND